MEHALILTLIKEVFDLHPRSIKRLAGYANSNYLIVCEKEKFIFKTYLWDQNTYDTVAAETAILSHLQEDKGTTQFPNPIATTGGKLLGTTYIDKEKIIFRMLSFVNGSFLGDLPATISLYQSLGSFLAAMNLRLKPLINYTLQSRRTQWDLQYFKLNEPHIEDIPDAHNRNIVRYFFLQYEIHVMPKLFTLRRQIIHGDANEWNVLALDHTVSGIIDFGDVSYSHLINEVAVAMTYAGYDKEEPLKWASIVLTAYHKTYPLKVEEVQLLYYLIAARLCTSVCNSAHARSTNPENTYATSSENAAWTTLHKWLRINPIYAENTFRKAINAPTIKEPSIDFALTQRHQYISPLLSISYDDPIPMDRAAFQYMYDRHGNTFLDAYNNIPQVGHCHPKVVIAGQRQMARLNTNTRYLYDQLAAYATRLLDHFPERLCKVFFVNSGSAASDLAIRMARAHTGYQHIMVTEHGYHGNTQIGIDISDYKFSNKKGQGKRDYILKTQIPDTCNGPYKKENAGHLYAQDAINLLQDAPEPIAAFVSEPIVGCGGQVPLASGYLKELYPAIRKQGGLCISDEVQTGFGRLGDVFWGYESQDVIPDMVILGKPIANGHPMGAVVTTEAVAASFGKGVEFFSSFGGNPVSCEIALAVLDVIQEEELQKKAKEVGRYYKSLFISLKAKYPCIGDVRGSGLFLGIEIIDPERKTTNRPLAHHIKNELRRRHILISTDGPDDSVIKTKPPLCFTKENAREVVNTIADILKLYDTTA